MFLGAHANMLFCAKTSITLALVTVVMLAEIIGTPDHFNPSV